MLEWQRSLGGSRAETAQAIRCTFDGGYIVAGRSFSNDGDVTGHHGIDSSPDYWITKLDSSGALEWQDSYGGINDDYAYSIEQTSDSGYIAVGYSTSTDGDVTGNHGELDYWVVRLSPSGSLTWQRSLGGSQGDFPHSVGFVDDGGYIIAGFSRSNDGDVTFNHGYEDVWIVKLESYTWIEETIAKPESFRLVAYPNPFNSAVKIRIQGFENSRCRVEIFDINGRSIDVIARSVSDEAISINEEKDCRALRARNDGVQDYIWQPGETFGSGVYLVRVKNPQHTGMKFTKRILYIK